MWALRLGIILIFAAVIYNVTALTVPSSFGCDNSLISDAWRKMVLEFHNSHRRRIAQGDQPTQGGVMPVAKNMNELTWDCNIEHNAWLYSCDTTTKLPNDYAVISADIKLANKNCDVNAVTKEQLNKWWNEAKSVDLKTDPQNKAGVEDFAAMANGAASGFACTYNKCNGGGKLVCLYNKKVAQNTNIYTKGNAGDICGSCDPQTLQCVDYLCQPDYSPATDTTPEPKCTNGKLTYNLEQTALNMHNYYRRLVATGWAKDSTGYAKWASQMPALTYDCTTAEKSNTQADCSKTAYTPEAAFSLNYHKEFYSGNYVPSREETLKKAVKAWFGQLANIDLGDDAMYNDNVLNNANFFANMIQEGATQLGCAVTQCAAQGFTVAVCQYNSIPQADSSLYTVGKTCSKCGAGQCEQLGGLCKP